MHSSKTTITYLNPVEERFSNLSIGDKFTWCGHLYMKVAPAGCSDNAVELQEGAKFGFGCEELVVPVDVTITVKR